jgi:hypothetical protein
MNFNGILECKSLSKKRAPCKDNEDKQELPTDLQWGVTACMMCVGCGKKVRWENPVSKVLPCYEEAGR